MGLATVKSDLYANLSANPQILDTGATVYPLTPVQGAVRPFLYFAVSDPTEGLTLRGGTGIYEYQVTVDGWTDSEDDQATLYDAVIASMHGWNGGASGNILVSKLQSGAVENVESTDDEEIYFFSQQYRVMTR